MHAHTALRDNGYLIAMGPNIAGPRRLLGFLRPLCRPDGSFDEGILTKCGFEVDMCLEKFLPYTMSLGRTYPLWMLRAYLAMPAVWPLFGRQFLLIARKR